MSPRPTRERILDAAEKLFAHNGFGPTSLRAITAEARANLAAVNYHFGSKEELLRAVVRRRIEPINRRRIELLDLAIERADGGLPSLEEILEAFLRPPIEGLHGAGRSDLMRLILMLHTEPEVVSPSFFRELFDEVILRFQVLGQALPHLDVEELIWRFHFMIGAMMQCVSDAGARHDPRIARQGDDPELLLRRLLRFTVAGFEAPATAHATGAAAVSPQKEPAA